MIQKSHTRGSRPHGHELRFVALLGVLTAASCAGGTIEGGTGFTPPPGAAAPGDDDGAEGSAGDGSGTGGDASSTAESRVVRLSHRQYQNTVRDLLGIEANVGETFAPDALNGFSFDTFADLRVDARLAPQYRTAAEELAARVIADDAIFGRVVPCTPTEPGCAGEFIESFGARAFRRPLSEVEVDRFQALFALGGELGEGGDDFREGVGLVLEAMLQSPQFLYRTEVTSGAIVNGREALDSWEVASRLSYFLYDSMPDEELFQKARRGELESPEQIQGEVSRMLGDARAMSKLVSFHEQSWQFGRFAKIAPDPARYPDLPTNLIERLRNVSSRFIESVIEDGGGLEEFLTAPYAYVDPELAPLYGERASGTGMSRIEFTDGERKGFLMQLGFLASHAYSVKTDPIHRGVFILRDVLCRNIPDPPADATNTPLPETDEPIETTREEVTVLTGQSYCPSCHSQINEPGFSFESFDALGRERTQENGVDVDTSGSITLDGDVFEFDGAGDLVEALAASSEARDCYTRRLLEFAYGRRLGDTDEALRARIAAEPLSVEDIVTNLTTSPEFSSRALPSAAR